MSSAARLGEIIATEIVTLIIGLYFGYKLLIKKKKKETSNEVNKK